MRSYRIFFAIPFDSATSSLYDRVIRTIKIHHPNITTEIGDVEVGPSPTYSEIATFKGQNRELNTQFKNKIQIADIVVADLTNNNPNVHFELGIALMQNKNILRVTGRSVTELGFDIRNLKVHKYENDTELTKTILDYLSTFLKIKQLEKSDEFASLYRESSNEMSLDSFTSGKPSLDLIQVDSAFRLRDGKVRVDFQIEDAKTPMDWFGIYFRVVMHPMLGSHLVYVRQNGGIEIAVYPNLRVLPEKVPIGNQVLGRHRITIEFDNNYLNVQMDETPLQSYQLTHQEVGEVMLATWNAKAKVYSVEVVCRDAIEAD